MIWILATTGASTKLRTTPFTETAIEGVESVVYKPGITPTPYSGGDPAEGELGTYGRGLRRITGYVFSFGGTVAEALFGITDEVDLIVRYRANGQKRKRTLKDVVFVGDATITLPGLNTGRAEVIGIPFRVQIPDGQTLAAHIVDAVDA